MAVCEGSIVRFEGLLVEIFVFGRGAFFGRAQPQRLLRVHHLPLQDLIWADNHYSKQIETVTTTVFLQEGNSLDTLFMTVFMGIVPSASKGATVSGTLSGLDTLRCNLAYRFSKSH